MAKYITALFHWGHCVCHANSEAPAATICRDNHSMPSWSPSPLLTSHAWMCQLLLQHNLNRPKFSVIDSMLIQFSTSWFKITVLFSENYPLAKSSLFSVYEPKLKGQRQRYQVLHQFQNIKLESILFNDQILFFDLYLLGNAIQNQFWFLKSFALSMILKKRPWKWCDTCLLAKMSSEASLSSFSWTSLASSLQDSARRSLLLLSTTNITAVTDKITGHRKITFCAK